tara:strand:+ start:541 stop:750 length:210 start_codon:yes stop_codon:yes gene_type:complete
MKSTEPIRNVPDLSSSLIKKLDELYPKRFPDLSWSDREIWFKAGQRNVVDFLKKVHDEQNETILASTKD